jgi:hypothetical protein
MTLQERESAIVAEAQARANSSGMAQTVYYRFGAFGVTDGSWMAPAGAEIVATIDPQDAARAYERPTVAPAGPYSTDLLI